jgi:hypothetical protein
VIIVYLYWFGNRRAIMKRGKMKEEALAVKTLSPENGLFRVLLFLFLILAMLASTAHGEMQRRMNVGFGFNYYLLDSDYFGMEDGFGVGFAFRYEIANNAYLENMIGRFTSHDGVVDIDGLNYHLDLLAIFPVLIPYRPFMRFGVGFLSVNPITVTPTETYRPAQTAFYLIGGGGFTRSFRENIFVEASADFYMTPYQYTIYEFDRSSVSTRDTYFSHLVFGLGVSYSF